MSRSEVSPFTFAKALSIVNPTVSLSWIGPYCAPMSRPIIESEDGPSDRLSCFALKPAERSGSSTPRYPMPKPIDISL